MTDHFTLEVHPAELRAVATRMGDLREHLVTKGTATQGVPEEIGDGWTGDAATDMKAEMTALGGRMTSFSTQLHTSADSLRTLATHYRDALDELPGLNRRYEEAQEDWSAAIGRASTDRDDQEEDLRDRGVTVNSSVQTELEGVQSRAVSRATRTRDTAVQGLETEFAHLKRFLRQETEKMASALRENAPMSVSDDQIEQWRSGQGPQLDRTAVMVGFAQMQRRLEEQQREAARDDVQSDLSDLDEAMDSDDPDAINDALEALGEHADDPVYTAVLVDELGADGIQQLYLDLDEQLTSSNTDMETLWPAMEGLNDAIAHGISTLSDASLTAGLENFMDEDYGPKIWALIAASDYADGRINAAALAYHSEIYNAALNNAGAMPGLFPQVFNYAYGDEDMLDQLDARSSGEDLARIVQNASEDHLDDLMDRMLNVNTDGGTMNEDDFAHVADLYRETVAALQESYREAAEDGLQVDPDPLVRLLNGGGRLTTREPYYSMLDVEGLAESVARDPQIMRAVLTAIDDSRVDPTALLDLVERSGVPLEEITAQAMASVAQDGTAEEAANLMGSLLRAEDIMGEDFNWGVVAKSLIESGITAAAGTNPVTAGLSGPVMSLFNALTGELARMEQMGEDFDTAAERNAAQDLIAFTLYTQYHGVPDGFEDYLDEQSGSGVDHNDLVLGFLDEMRGGRGGVDPRQWEEMRLIINTIDETRDEQ